MAGNDSNQDTSMAGAASEARAKAGEVAQDLRDKGASKLDEYKDTAKGTANDLSASAGDAASQLKDQAKSLTDDLKQRANQHVGEAKDVVASFASEARSKVADIVDQQKNAGAEQLSTFSRAAHSAAGDLEEQSPQVAKLVRDAASTVESFAGDLRSSSLGDVVASVTSFARKQPVAFFGASVLAGFVLARFVKSEPAPEIVEPRPRRSQKR